MPSHAAGAVLQDADDQPERLGSHRVLLQDCGGLGRQPGSRRLGAQEATPLQASQIRALLQHLAESYQPRILRKADEVVDRLVIVRHLFASLVVLVRDGLGDHVDQPRLAQELRVGLVKQDEMQRVLRFLLVLADRGSRRRPRDRGCSRTRARRRQGIQCGRRRRRPLCGAGWRSEAAAREHFAVVVDPPPPNRKVGHHQDLRVLLGVPEFDTGMP